MLPRLKADADHPVARAGFNEHLCRKLAFGVSRNMNSSWLQRLGRKRDRTRRLHWDRRSSAIPRGYAHGLASGYTVQHGRTNVHAITNVQSAGSIASITAPLGSACALKNSGHRMIRNPEIPRSSYSNKWHAEISH